MNTHPSGISVAQALWVFSVALAGLVKLLAAPGTGLQLGKLSQFVVPALLQRATGYLRRKQRETQSLLAIA